MSTLRLLSLSTVSEEGGRVGGSDWSTSRDEADDGADGDSLLASLASGLGDIVTRSEKVMDNISALLINPGDLWLSCSHSVDVEKVRRNPRGTTIRGFSALVWR